MDPTPLIQTLRSRCGFETIHVEATDRQVRLMGRQAQARMGDWLLLMHHVLQRTARGTRWSVDFSKNYFLTSGSLKYGWRVIFQSQDVNADLQDIVNAISGAPQTSRREVMEIPLLGVSPDRNAPNGKGKGAGATDRYAVGPLQLAMMPKG